MNDIKLLIEMLRNGEFNSASVDPIPSYVRKELWKEHKIPIYQTIYYVNGVINPSDDNNPEYQCYFVYYAGRMYGSQESDFQWLLLLPPTDVGQIENIVIELLDENYTVLAQFDAETEWVDQSTDDTYNNLGRYESLCDIGTNIDIKTVAAVNVRIYKVAER